MKHISHTDTQLEKGRILIVFSSNCIYSFSFRTNTPQTTYLKFPDSSDMKSYTIRTFCTVMLKPSAPSYIYFECGSHLSVTLHYHTLVIWKICVTQTFQVVTHFTVQYWKFTFLKNITDSPRQVYYWEAALLTVINRIIHIQYHTVINITFLKQILSLGTNTFSCFLQSKKLT